MSARSGAQPAACPGRNPNAREAHAFAERTPAHESRDHRRHTDDNAAREHLESLLWPDGPICPNCGVVNQAALGIDRKELRAARSV